MINIGSVRKRGNRWQARWVTPEGGTGSCTRGSRAEAIRATKLGEAGVPVIEPETLYPASAGCGQTVSRLRKPVAP
jgi:hypothetical protein